MLGVEVDNRRGSVLALHQVIEAADAYVLARESDQDGWDEYVALRQAVLERNEALIDGD